MEFVFGVGKPGGCSADQASMRAEGSTDMITSRTEFIGRRVGGFLSITILLTVALLVAAPSLGSANAKLWLYPESDDPRAGGHVVTDDEFTIFPPVLQVLGISAN